MIQFQKSPASWLNKYAQGGPGSSVVVTVIATLEVAYNFVQVNYKNSCHGYNSIGMLCLLCLLLVPMTLPSAFATVRP
jgi:hypothetical protein